MDERCLETVAGGFTEVDGCRTRATQCDRVERYLRISGIEHRRILNATANAQRKNEQAGEQHSDGIQRAPTGWLSQLRMAGVSHML